MLKKILAALLALFAAVAFAAVDANKATPAELDSVKGIGPAIAGKIVDERKNGAFKDWNDLITRVKGIGDTNAAKLSAGGLTVNGTSYNGATPAAKAEEKPAKTSKKSDKAAASTEAAPAATTPASAPSKADAKKEAAEKKAAAKKEKAEKAAAAKAEKEAKAASAAEAKKSKKKAKAEAAADGASGAKPAKK